MYGFAAGRGNFGVRRPGKMFAKPDKSGYSLVAMPLPVLRYLDATPIPTEEGTLVCLHDPEGFSEQQLLLSPPAFYIATLLDGANDVPDIQYSFMNQFGQAIRTEEIRQVVEALDNAGFLLTARFLDMRQRAISSFAAGTVRPAYFAGRSYPEDPEELRAFLDAMFTGEGGPGQRPSLNGDGHSPLPGLIVPHIDFSRGGPTYAHGYLRLAQGGRPDTVFVFGVAHNAPPVPVVLTRKDFETPLGTVATDRDVVDALAEACSWDPFEHEIIHRTEHSIEFQAVMLAYLYGAKVRIVPILCGAFLDEDDEMVPGVDEFLARCQTLAAEPGRRVSVVAGADLAHVGQRFGDDFEICEAVVNHVEMRDREDLGYVAKLHPAAFYRSVMKDGNARRVCGLNCIYSALRTLEGRASRGEIVNYGYAPDPSGGMVSFANVVLQ